MSIPSPTARCAGSAPRRRQLFLRPRGAQDLLSLFLRHCAFEFLSACAHLDRFAAFVLSGLHGGRTGRAATDANLAAFGMTVCSPGQTECRHFLDSSSLCRVAVTTGYRANRNSAAAKWPTSVDFPIAVTDIDFLPAAKGLCLLQGYRARGCSSGAGLATHCVTRTCARHCDPTSASALRTTAAQRPRVRGGSERPYCEQSKTDNHVVSLIHDMKPPQEVQRTIHIHNPHITTDTSPPSVRADRYAPVYIVLGVLDNSDMQTRNVLKG